MAARSRSNFTGSGGASPKVEVVGVLDEAANDYTVAAVQYNITSFGADYDVEGLVRRVDRQDIYVPSFQRAYVWSISEASRFIESLLLGLPVPGIFLARDTQSSRLLVIDGQQRLRSLHFFVQGYFNPKEGEIKRRIFSLEHVQRKFEGLTYETLLPDDKRIFNDSIIHATIVRQDSPKDDDTSIYHIFERLNNSGRKLTPQQIRVAIYWGPFMDLIRVLNQHDPWRRIFGGVSVGLKDQELILRFLALKYFSGEYERPMNEFLNKFAIWARNQESKFYDECSSIFHATVDAVISSVGDRAFRPERAINAAVFDSVMVAIARLIESGTLPPPGVLKNRYNRLLSDETYMRAVSQSTSDEKNVRFRLELVTRSLSEP